MSNLLIIELLFIINNLLTVSQAHSALTSLKNVFARKFYHDNLPLAERKLLLNVRAFAKTAFCYYTSFSDIIIIPNLSHYKLRSKTS